MSDQQELQAKLTALGDSYAAELPEKLSQIEMTFGQLQGKKWNEQGFQTFFSFVHGLIGSGKSFGFTLLSDVARNLETYLSSLARAKVALNNEQRKHIQELIRELHQAASQRDTSAVDQSALIAIAHFGQDSGSPRRIFLVEDDRQLAEEMKVQLGYFGYEVTVFNTTSNFRLAIDRTPDVIVLMDISFPEEPLGGINVMKEVQQGREVPIPVVFI
jgi:HPt (histidine-containing phosphotransfer) domain-containing protein